MTPGHFVTPLDTPSHSLSLVASRRLHSHDTGTLCDTILYQVTPCRQLASRRLQMRAWIWGAGTSQGIRQAPPDVQAYLTCINYALITAYPYTFFVHTHARTLGRPAAACAQQLGSGRLHQRQSLQGGQRMWTVEEQGQIGGLPLAGLRWGVQVACMWKYEMRAVKGISWNRVRSGGSRGLGCGACRVRLWHTIVTLHAGVTTLALITHLALVSADAAAGRTAAAAAAAALAAAAGGTGAGAGSNPPFAARTSGVTAGRGG
eukprot:1161891-Pelagomonas_calceolata.AAC.5